MKTQIIFALIVLISTEQSLGFLNLNGQTLKDLLQSGLESGPIHAQAGPDHVGMRLRSAIQAKIAAIHAEPSLSYSPDVEYEAKLDMCPMIQYRGYPCEAYKVVTQDGFILMMFRIPHGKSGPTPGANKQAVLVQHGLFDSSYTWVTNFPHESLGFLLADAGYDVWFGNVRGNTYSRNHQSLKPIQKEFWYWSFDEMAKYDLPAMIDQALHVTGGSQVIYIGHSQGTLMGFTGFSKYPEIAAKVKLFIALAPVAKLGHINGALKLLAPEAKTIQDITLLFGSGEFLPDNIFISTASKVFCVLFPLEGDLCTSIMYLFMGDIQGNVNMTRLPVYMSHVPAGTSVINVGHFAQGVNQNTFAMCDYGKAENMKKYGQAVPPEYVAKDMKVPVGMFWSTADWLADPTDVSWLISQLPNIKWNKQYNKYSHLGFVWNPNAYTDVYKDALALMKSYT